jgi:hypothetical protein
LFKKWRIVSVFLAKGRPSLSSFSKEARVDPEKSLNHPTGKIKLLSRTQQKPMN